VDAGAAEARRVGTLVSTHVIARPSDQLGTVMPAPKPARGGGNKSA